MSAMAVVSVPSIVVWLTTVRLCLQALVVEKQFCWVGGIEVVGSGAAANCLGRSDRDDGDSGFSRDATRSPWFRWPGWP